MTVLILCASCKQAIDGEWTTNRLGQVHKDTAECARLKTLAESPFIRIAHELGRTVAEKNAAYGSAFAKSGDFLRLLFPDGIKPEQYTDMLLLVLIFDKQMRIATAKDALGENPFRDIAGYGILGVAKDA